MKEPLRRVFDVIVAATVLVLTSPLILIAAIAIKLTSRGPVIFRQQRVGYRGHHFEVLKLRSMVTGAEHKGAGLAVDKGDSRITTVGRFLRRTALDELPNLVNVLRGEMSIIGPRPTVQVQVDQYTERQLRRLEIRPGITGWAQVNGRASLPWPERIEMDIDYIEKRTTRLDLHILRLTARQVLSGGDDHYKGDTGGWKK
jgi:lipopolysaccharide/colanic/teichoic acid biosynthesis glycosyltransferase